MGPGIELVFALIAVVGLPVLAVGTVLRLVEWSWDKPRRSLGSGFFLGIGFALCVPLVLLIIWAAIASLARLPAPWRPAGRAVS